MSLETLLDKRSSCRCELCASETALSVYNTSTSTANERNSLMVCQVCKKQILGENPPDKNHWQCLAESMWSEYPAVQIITYRMLLVLSSEKWAMDLLGELSKSLNEDVITIAREGLEEINNETIYIKPAFLKK